MSRKNIVVMTLFLLIVVGAMFSVRHRSRLRRGEQQREQLLASTLAILSRDIRVGETRGEVDAYFKARNAKYFQRSTPGEPLLNDLAPLGRKPATTWGCGPFQFGVEIDFKPAEVRLSTDFTDKPTDQVSKVQPYEWADDCM